MKNCEFAICGLAHLRNLRISDSEIGPRICGLAFCGLKIFVCPPLLKSICMSALQILFQTGLFAA